MPIYNSEAIENLLRGSIHLRILFSNEYFLIRLVYLSHYCKRSNLLIFERFFDLRKKLFFLTPAYFNLHIIAHHCCTTFTTNIFFYMKKINQKRFVNAIKY